MIRVEHIGPDRLVLSNSPNLFVVALIAGFFLAATVLVWGAADMLDGFGMIFAVLWTALFIFIFTRFDWTRAVLDAKTNSLESTHYRLYKLPRRLRHDLRDLGRVTWDEIEIWGALIAPDEDVARARSTLIVRREHPTRRLTEQELAALGEPVKLSGLPETLPQVRIGDVIHAWRESAL